MRSEASEQGKLQYACGSAGGTPCPALLCAGYDASTRGRLFRGWLAASVDRRFLTVPRSGVQFALSCQLRQSLALVRISRVPGQGIEIFRQIPENDRVSHGIVSSPKWHAGQRVMTVVNYVIYASMLRVCKAGLQKTASPGAKVERRSSTGVEAGFRRSIDMLGQAWGTWPTPSWHTDGVVVLRLAAHFMTQLRGPAKGDFR